MTDEQMLALLRADLEQPSPTVNDYLLHLIEVAKERIAEHGIWLMDTARDNNLVIMYAAYLYRKRKADNPKGEEKMPRMLRSALNDRLIAEKGGGGT